MASQSSCRGSMGRIGPESHLWVRELSDQGREPCVTPALPGWEARRHDRQVARKRFPGRWSPAASLRCVWVGKETSCLGDRGCSSACHQMRCTKCLAGPHRPRVPRRAFSGPLWPVLPSHQGLSPHTGSFPSPSCRWNLADLTRNSLLGFSVTWWK